MFASTLRFWANGWVREFYLAPTFHFTYLGFGWLKPLPGAFMYLLFALLLAATLAIALGYRTRSALLVFFFGFTYAELLDKSFYLNHYYFVSLLTLLLVFLPLSRTFSLDVRARRLEESATVPYWTLLLPRLQLGLVYFFAGIAKLEPDWLWRAQPLTIWLRQHAEMPVLGPIFATSWAPYVMSWAGMLYDLTIVLFLCYHRTRLLAYLAVLGFHILTALLFPIGMFPWIMIVATLIFFPPAAFVRFARLARIPVPQARSRSYALPLAAKLFLLAFFGFQILMPLRHYRYPGSVLWHEAGYRFSWRVMLAEKTGDVSYTVRDPRTGQSYERFPEQELTPQQAKQMAYQPDMILQYAHHLAAQARAHGVTEPAVYAQSYVSLNGGSSRRFVKENVNLANIPYDLAPRTWLYPEP